MIFPQRILLIVNAPLCVLVTANSSVCAGVVTSAGFAIYLN